MLVPRIDRYGYCKVTFYDNGVTKHTTVHRVVAEAFLPNIYNKPSINHKDCNKLNNSVDNLEWVTHKENIHHAERNGLRNRARNGLGQFI